MILMPLPLYAESMMNLQPWDYWTMDGQPRGRIDEIVDRT